MQLLSGVHRGFAATAPLALICAAAIPQGIEKRSAPVPPTVQAVEAEWLPRAEFVGCEVRSEKGLEPGSKPQRVGTLTDVIVDTGNFTVPHAVIEVEKGPRTAVDWAQCKWDPKTRMVTVDLTIEELRKRAEIEPDLAATSDAGAGAAAADGGDEAAADRAGAVATGLHERVLGSRLEGVAVHGRDGRFGKLKSLVLDPRSGVVQVLTIATPDGAEHVVPAAIAAPQLDEKKALVLKLDRDLATLEKTPQLGREDMGLGDPAFRKEIWQAVGLNQSVPDAAPAGTGR